MRRTAALVAAAGLFLLVGCGRQGVAPPGAYLTLNVSAHEVVVKTVVDGRTDDFLSGGEEGDLVASEPLNKALHEGENEIVFTLKKRENISGALEPSFNATLELAGGEEIVDTSAANERVIFSRDLHEEEAARLDSGEEVTITEVFTLSREKLTAMAAKGS